MEGHKEKVPPDDGGTFESGRLNYFSHFWLATPQLVLQADWQEV